MSFTESPRARGPHNAAVEKKLQRQINEGKLKEFARLKQKGELAAAREAVAEEINLRHRVLPRGLRDWENYLRRNMTKLRSPRYTCSVLPQQGYERLKPTCKEKTYKRVLLPKLLERSRFPVDKGHCDVSNLERCVADVFSVDADWWMTAPEDGSLKYQVLVDMEYQNNFDSAWDRYFSLYRLVGDEVTAGHARLKR